MSDEEMPAEVMKDWISQCGCCSDCSQVPCDGVMAGGMCDESCECEDDDDPDYMFNEVL